MKLLNLNGEILHEDAEAKTLTELIRSANKAGASTWRAVLSGADLRGAVLRGADLSDADLRDADLRDADLRDADLRGAVLRDAVLSGADLRGAVLRGADLRDAVLRDAVLSGADLRGAVLRGADLSDADLRDADLRDAVLRGGGNGIYAPKIPDIHKRILEAVNAPGCKLEMGSWHACETTHCRAGWVVTLAGEAGKVLESCIGTAAAAALIYQASDPTMGKVPNFFTTNEAAMDDMKKMAGVAP